MSLKENVNKEIGEKTAELYFEGMSYEEALKKAKEAVEKIEKYQIRKHYRNKR